MPSRCLLHIPTSRSEPQPASSRLAVDLRPSSCLARSNLEPTRHHLRRRQKPLSFLVPLYILDSCHLYHHLYLLHDLSILCLCRAFASVYLSIYPFSSLVLWMYVLLRVIVVLVLLFSHLSSCGSCGLCVVLVALDRAFEPVRES